MDLSACHPVIRGKLKEDREACYIDASNLERTRLENAIAGDRAAILQLLLHNSRSAAHGELAELPEDAPEELRDDYREALRLHYSRRLSVAETAKRMER